MLLCARIIYITRTLNTILLCAYKAEAKITCFRKINSHIFYFKCEKYSVGIHTLLDKNTLIHPNFQGLN